jgi:hypothetical protein
VHPAHKWSTGYGSHDYFSLSTGCTTRAVHDRFTGSGCARRIGVVQAGEANLRGGSGGYRDGYGRHPAVRQAQQHLRVVVVGEGRPGAHHTVTVIVNRCHDITVTSCTTMSPATHKPCTSHRPPPVLSVDVIAPTLITAIAPSYQPYRAHRHRANLTPLGRPG